jgi:uncharacterized protein (TIGR02996 family)
MLSDRDALFAAICANTAEDTPRLMFADWLEENGDPDRAEFVRLQCELAALADDGASHAMYAFLHDRYRPGLMATDWTRVDMGVHRLLALETRAGDLQRQHAQQWLPKTAKRCKAEWVGFHRGFPHWLDSRDWRAWKHLAPVVSKSAPALALHYTGNEFSAEAATELARTGLLGRIEVLVLLYNCAEGLGELGNHPEAAGVRSLTLRAGFDDQIAEALARGPHWTGLHDLDLSGTIPNADAAEVLFEAKNLRTLRRLHLYGGWGPDTIQAIATADFTELTSLRLSHCGLDDDAAEILAGCSRLANLRTLDLEGNYLTGRGATALLTSPHLANVAYLGLDDNPCNGLDADRLAAASPAALRLLHFHGSRLRTADVRALARCPRLRTLWYLDLDANNIGTTAVRELVRGFKDFCPPILWLTYNRIDDRGAELLANWPAAAGLSALHLKYNSAMTDTGVRAILDSSVLTNLDSLGVSTENTHLNSRLRARFRHYDKIGY